MPGGPREETAEVSLDDFTFDPVSGRLSRDADEITLRPKTAAVLSCLIRHDGALVSRNDLLDEIWPEGFVTDAVLTVCINELRAAFGDDRRNPRFIATLPRRGYQLLAAATRSSPAPERSAEDAQPFVGREAEIERLARAWREAMRGSRQLVFVAAQAGVGKTALVDRFAAQVVAQDQALIGRGQCIEQFGGREPYLPMLDALSGLCRGGHGGRFIDILASVAPTWLMQIPAVAGLERFQQLRAATVGASSERMLREFAIALEVATAQQPLVIVCEDLQESDWSTTELLRYLAVRRDPARLLVIGTYRPADLVARDHPLRHVVADLRVHAQCELLPLELLSRDAVHAYVAERLRPRSPSDALVDDLHARTDGNALFTSAVVDFLTAEGLLVDRDGEVHCEQPLELVGVPASITQLIEHQIDELDDSDREVLEAASAVGVDFTTDAIVAALGDRADAAGEVDERCSRLARRTSLLVDGDLVRWPDGTLTAGYRFRHALFREVLHGRITHSRRRAVHCRIGARLAAAWEDGAGELASELAMHFEQGEDLPRAVEFLALAAETAQRRVAPRETLDHANHGLDLLARIGPMPGRGEIELRLRIQQVVAMTALQGLYGESVERAYEQARRVAADVDDPALVGPVVYGLWKIAVASSRTADMDAMSDELGQLAGRLGDRVLAMRADLMSGLVEIVSGRLAAGVARTRRCLERYDADADGLQALVYGDDAAVDAHRVTAIALWYLGYPDQARHHADESCRRAIELGYPHDIFRATTGAMYVDALCRDVGRVRARVQDLLAACERIGMDHMPHQATIVDAWAVAVSDGSPGRETFEPSAADLLIVRRHTFLSSLVAETAAALGDTSGALRIASTALEVGRASGHVQYEPELLRLIGDLTLRTDGAIEQAERAMLEAIDIAHRREARSLELRAATSLARLWYSRGERDRARDLLAPIYGWFTEGHDTANLRDAAALLAELDSATPAHPVTVDSPA